MAFLFRVAVLSYSEERLDMTNIGILIRKRQADVYRIHRHQGLNMPAGRHMGMMW